MDYKNTSLQHEANSRKARKVYNTNCTTHQSYRLHTSKTQEYNISNSNKTLLGMILFVCFDISSFA